MTPGDGPTEFHLSCSTTGGPQRLADKVGRSALHCIRCSACLNVCPVYERVGGHAYGSAYPADRRRPHPQLAADHGHDSVSSAALRLEPLRGVLRRWPGEDRHPQLLVDLRTRVVDDERARRRTPTAEQATHGGNGLGHGEPRPGPDGQGRRQGRPRFSPAGAASVGRRSVRPPGPPHATCPRHPRRHSASGGRAHEAGTLVTAREDVLARVRDGSGNRAARVEVPRAYRTVGLPRPRRISAAGSPRGPPRRLLGPPCAARMRTASRQEAGALSGAGRHPDREGTGPDVELGNDVACSPTTRHARSRCSTRSTAS